MKCVGSHEATQCLKSTPSHQPGDGSHRRELKAVSQPIDGSDQQWLPQVGSPPVWLAPLGWGGRSLASKKWPALRSFQSAKQQQGAASQPCSDRGGARGAWLKEASGLLQSLLPACCQLAPPQKLHLSPLTPPPPTSSPWAADGCWLLEAGWVTPKWSKLGFSAEGRGGEPQQRRLLLCCWWFAPTAQHCQS